LEFGKFSQAFGKVLVVWIFRTVGGDRKCFQARIQLDSYPRGWHGFYFYVRVAKRNKVFAVGILADCGEKDVVLRFLGALYEGIRCGLYPHALKVGALRHV